MSPHLNRLADGTARMELVVDPTQSCEMFLVWFWGQGIREPVPKARPACKSVKFVSYDGHDTCNSEQIVIFLRTQGSSDCFTSVQSE